MVEDKVDPKIPEKGSEEIGVKNKLKKFVTDALPGLKSKSELELMKDLADSIFDTWKDKYTEEQQSALLFHLNINLIKHRELQITKAKETLGKLTNDYNKIKSNNDIIKKSETNQDE